MVFSTLPFYLQIHNGYGAVYILSEKCIMVFEVENELTLVEYSMHKDHGVCTNSFIVIPKGAFQTFNFSFFYVKAVP